MKRFKRGLFVMAAGGLTLASGCDGGVLDIVYGSIQLTLGIVSVAT